MEKRDFFKMFCEFKGIGNKYAYGKVTCDNKYLEFIDGSISQHLYSNGDGLIDGQLYCVTGCCCGYDTNGLNSCTIGKPNQKCIDTKTYSVSKCAVYNFKPVDINTYVYNLTFDEILLVKKLF